MKILALPLTTLKSVSEKAKNLFATLKNELAFLLNISHSDRPSRMYRLIFSAQHRGKPVFVKEQYVVQEPDYYGNYE